MQAHEVMISHVHKLKESDSVGIISRGDVIRNTFKSLL
jgi:hypothetical protein